MNIILFRPDEVEHPLPRKDARARHIVEVLRLQPGDTFDAGWIDGPRGKGTLVAKNEDSLTLLFTWSKAPPPLWPIHVLIGLPRPQTSRDLLRELTALGVASIRFFCSERSEASYSSSTLWKSDEWRKCVINGAAQAFCTRLPEITHDETLTDALTNIPLKAARVALDNYEATASFTDFNPGAFQTVVLAVGAERGWSPGERILLRSSSFGLAHLGTRVLRTETASIAAVALIRSKLGLF